VAALTIKSNTADPRSALLSLKIVDPACGSGHFLLAAARRIAAEIARIEAGTDTPDEAARQHALREVLQRCIYGVDRNPFAVELCRTALWIETVEPGKPLTFLEPHIRCGDSLVGIIDPAILADGIPDEAYRVLTGDDKAVCRDLKKQNRTSGSGVQGSLFDRESFKTIATTTAALDEMPEETLVDIESKRAAWEACRADTSRKLAELRADLFVGAFFASKQRETLDRVSRTEDLNRVSRGMAMRPGVEVFARELARKHLFFHWSLAFAEVMQKGGFDVILGNPPWERIKLQEQEFFAGRSPEIANAPNKAARAQMIKALGRSEAHPAEKTLLRSFEEAKREAEAASQFVRSSGRFPLTGTGDINTYALFAETITQILAPRGRAGFIVPSGLATDNTTKSFFGSLISNQALESFFEFENEGFFQGAGQGHMLRFALTTIVGSATRVEMARFLFQGKDLADLSDGERVFMLSPEDIFLVNPNTRTCPIFRSHQDSELTKSIYARVPILMREGDIDDPRHNPWGISFMAMFHMANDSHLFKTKVQLEDEGFQLNGNRFDKVKEHYVPLYEAKMIHQYNNRHGDFCDVPDGERAHVLPTTPVSRLRDPNYLTLPYYWVAQDSVEQLLEEKDWSSDWLIGWRDVTDARASARTLIASVIPKSGVNDKFLLMLPDAPAIRAAALLGNLCSLVCDYIARQKVGGLALKYFTMKQLPILAPEHYSETDLRFIRHRILELTYTARDLEAWARDLDYEGTPFDFDPDRRAVLRAELDAYYARLYGLNREALGFILDPQSIKPGYPSETFSVLKRYEEKKFGEYRTQNLVLDAWDRFVADGTIKRHAA
jgi:Eco57I restriction-modification methylase